MTDKAVTEKLRNIGPKSMAWLRQTGIRTLDELKAVGALPAFVRIKRAGFKPSLNLLYALEGAILDCHWQEIPDARRAELICRRGNRSRQAAQGPRQGAARRGRGDDDAHGLVRRGRRDAGARLRLR